MQKLNPYIWLPLLLLSFVVGGLRAQSKAQFLEAAETYYDYGDYANAAYLFGEALEFDSTDHQVRFRRAESNLLYRAYKRAIADFEAIEAAGVDTFLRLPYLWGKAEQPLGEYDAAIRHFTKFLEGPGDEATLEEIEDAERQRENSAWAKEVWAEHKLADETGLLGAVKPIPYEGVNNEYDDFAPYFVGNTFYFSSLRFPVKKDSIKPERMVAKIIRRDTTALSASNEPLPPPINRTGLTAAHSAFNGAGTMVYFTYCEYQTDSLQLRCDLFMAPVATDGTWGAPEKLALNVEGANTTHPNVGTHPDGTEYLYFASDRADGQGMHDLYRAPLGADGKPGTVASLDDLNTAFDDVTPFYYAPQRELYFSTDGRNTLGGLDVYRAGMTTYGWTDPTHLGILTNSSSNDVYYARFEDQQTAYFASNRPGAEAICWKEGGDICCNDIYEIEIPKVCLEVTTFHALTKAELNGTTVVFYEELDGGERVERARETHDYDNLYTFEVELGRKYGVMATKRGLKGDEAVIDVSLGSPAVPADGSCIQQPLYLPPPNIRLEVTTFDKRDSSPLSGCTVRLQKDNLAPTEKSDPDGNFYAYDIVQEKYYDIHGSKENYSSDSAFVDTRGLFILNDTVIKRELFLEPQLPCEIEPTVYFHNDRPVKGDPHTITPANYMDTYETYVNTHKTKYYTRWVKSNADREKVMDDFFTEVDNGKKDLEKFAAMLEEYLTGGGSITVTLQGFASPLAKGPYNDKLSARRCISIINYLEAYNGGVLKNYLDNSLLLMFNEKKYEVPRFHGGIPVRTYDGDPPKIEEKKLVFDIRPGGEVRANPAKGLVDTGEGSVYSPVAGRARYVEVKVAGCPQSPSSYE